MFNTLLRNFAALTSISFTVGVGALAKLLSARNVDTIEFIFYILSCKNNNLKKNSKIKK